MLRKKNKQRCFNQQFGFTITELLVVIFIISLLSALTLVGYRSSQKRYALSQDSQRLMASLRKAQNMAMSGIDISGQYYGYGLKLDSSSMPNSYIIFADKNNDQDYDVGDEIIETINLSSKIEVQSLSSSPLNIFFSPPNPTTYINGSTAVGVSGTVTLGIEDTLLTKTITVTTAGLIQRN